VRYAKNKFYFLYPTPNFRSKKINFPFFSSKRNIFCYHPPLKQDGSHRQADLCAVHESCFACTTVRMPIFWKTFNYSNKLNTTSVVVFEPQVSTTNKFLQYNFFFSVLSLVIHLDKWLANCCRVYILMDVPGHRKHERKELELNWTGKIITQVKICTVCEQKLWAITAVFLKMYSLGGNTLSDF